ncbi:hypothetical protein KFU94_50760 [Chloroflexi bacterium TSY]|nr:hypothetical protein [Chloroflexi bacterium TSY]
MPLQTYDELRRIVQTDFLRDATEDENRAENAQREFDQNRTALAREMQNLRLTYDTRLLELCGPTQDDFATCDSQGGLMKQNELNMDTTSIRINQVKKRQENVFEQVEIEQERTNEIIRLTLENGKSIAATALAQGAINAVRSTDMVVDSSSTEAYIGFDRSLSVSYSINPANWFSAKDTLSLGLRHSESHTSSTTTVFDPAQEELAELQSAQAMQQAINQSAIISATSAATVKGLLLQIAELTIEEELLYAEMNRLSAAHNDLVNQYHHLLNLREQAQADLVDSNLANPAFRLLRDQNTIEATRSHSVAAQFAYLSARRWSMSS